MKTVSRVRSNYHGLSNVTKQIYQPLDITSWRTVTVVLIDKTPEHGVQPRSYEEERLNPAIPNLLHSYGINEKVPFGHNGCVEPRNQTVTLEIEITPGRAEDAKCPSAV